MRLTRSGTRTATVLMMIAAAALVPLATQAPAQAAQAAPNSTAGTAGWTPYISPLFPGSGEWVKRNVSSFDRHQELLNCAAVRGYACVSVGQGDGRHSLFRLYHCQQRSLSNFIDAVAIRNNQTHAAVLSMFGEHFRFDIPGDGLIRDVPDYITYDSHTIRVC